ncbi:MAG: hypothetical protein WA030_02950 [Candidatus Microsaccharimonas sp.]
MKEVIWVYGTSGSGKETFIKSLLVTSDLKKAFQLDNKTLVASEESLRNLGQLDNSRSSILEEVANLIRTNDVVVIKWQYGDTLLNSPNVLYERFPNLKHVVIRLNVEADEQTQRLKTKSWWTDNGKESEFIEKEISLVESSIKALNPAFDIFRHNW